MNFNIRKNTIFSIVEVIINSLSIFILYKYVVGLLGVKYLGVWSAVLAATSMARFGDIGAAAGLSKYVAEEYAKNDLVKARKFIDTALIFNIILYCIIALVLYFPLNMGLKFIISKDMIGYAIPLIPYTIVSFALLNITSAILTSLVGLQINYIRSIINIIGTFIQVIVSLLFIKNHGLVGIAYGQISQYIFVIIISWLFVTKYTKVSKLELLPSNFDKKILRELIGYGLKLQFTSIVSFLFDPITKFALSKFCGLDTLGYYEMANRFSVQLRLVIASPIQNMVATFAGLKNLNSDKLEILYSKATSIVIISTIIYFLLVTFSSPILSILWLKKLNFIMISFAIIMAIGWSINLIASVSYVMSLSLGSVKGNLIGHIVTLIIVLLTVPIFQNNINGIYSICGVSMAISLGAIITIIYNNKIASSPKFPDNSTIYKNIKKEVCNTYNIAYNYIINRR